MTTLELGQYVPKVPLDPCDDIETYTAFFFDDVIGIGTGG